MRTERKLVGAEKLHEHSLQNGDDKRGVQERTLRLLRHHAVDPEVQLGPFELARRGLRIITPEVDLDEGEPQATDTAPTVDDPRLKKTVALAGEILVQAWVRQGLSIDDLIKRLSERGAQTGHAHSTAANETAPPSSQQSDSAASVGTARLDQPAAPDYATGNDSNASSSSAEALESFSPMDGPERKELPGSPQDTEEYSSELHMAILSEIYHQFRTEVVHDPESEEAESSDDASDSSWERVDACPSNLHGEADPPVDHRQPTSSPGASNARRDPEPSVRESELVEAVLEHVKALLSPGARRRNALVRDFLGVVVILLAGFLVVPAVIPREFWANLDPIRWLHGLSGIEFLSSVLNSQVWRFITLGFYSGALVVMSILSIVYTDFQKTELKMKTRYSVPCVIATSNMIFIDFVNPPVVDRFAFHLINAALLVFSLMMLWMTRVPVVPSDSRAHRAMRALMFVVYGWILWVPLWNKLMALPSPVASLCVVAGGLLYSIGGGIYALSSPTFAGPAGKWYLFIVGGAIAQYVAVAIRVYFY